MNFTRGFAGTVLLLLHITGTSVQQGLSYTAVVVDGATGAPVAYANIGLPRQGLGTVTDSAGRFTLSLPPDTTLLSVSMTGYQEAHLSTGKLPSGRIELVPKAVQLHDLTVKARVAQKRWVGNRTYNPLFSAGLGDCKPGYGIGSVLQAPWTPSFIEEMRFDVNRCSYDSVFLRLVLLQQGDSGWVPLLERPVYIRLSRHQALKNIVVDLRRERIAVSGPFLAGLEFVTDLGPGDFSLASKSSGTRTLVRFNSGTG